RARRAAFEAACHPDPPDAPIIAFVGTFDERKGAADFPEIVEQVVAAVPAAKFKLLGTAGLTTSVDQVLRSFPRSMRAAIDVIPQFDPDDLPKLLSDCAVGMFP